MRLKITIKTLFNASQSLFLKSKGVASFMLRLPIQDVLPGMFLAQPVAHPQRANFTLLTGGLQLTDRAIAQIAKLGVATLWIEHPSFAIVDRYVPSGIHQIYDELKVETLNFLDSLGHAGRRGWTHRLAAEDLIRRLLLEMSTQREALIFKDDPPLATQPWIATHAASTCYLTALLAIDLHAYIQRERRKASATPQQEMMHLCLGALVHDIGLRKLKVEDYERWVVTGEEHPKRWQNHVKLGYDLVREHLEASSATVVLHHHQFYDQSGFPHRLNWEGQVEAIGGSDLHIFARIVTAADQFDELKHQPDGTIWPNVRTLKYLLIRDTWARLDPRVARAILQVVPAYTPGSIVTLSNGQRGFVIDWKPASPCYPTVAIVNDLSDLIYDPEKTADFIAPNPDRRPQPTPDYPWAEQTHAIEYAIRPFKAINLAHTHDLHIVQSEGTDVADDNFSLPAKIRPRHKAGAEFGVHEAA